MNEQDYQLLIDLYETKNITKVADQHFLTQPALTKRLRRIEEELGSVLLVRSRKGVVFNLWENPLSPTAVRCAR